MSTQGTRQGRFASGMRVACEWCCAPLRFDGVLCGDALFTCTVCNDRTMQDPSRVQAAEHDRAVWS